MAFKGWPAEAIEFFEGLEADNSKSYWQTNKKIYEECVKAPMVELLAELAPEYGEGKIFRPYRDVRFSADKSPYKTNIAAVLAKGGYLHLSADEFGVGTGMYHMEADQLERYRRAVADDATGGELARLVKTLARSGIEVSAHDILKTAPKGYPRDHPRVDLLRQKGLITWRSWPVGAWLGTKQPRSRVAGFLRASQPVLAWLEANVGASSAVPADA